MRSPSQLLADIRAGKFKPVYYFFGDEDYRIAEAVRYLVSQYLPEEQRKVNFRRFDARQVKAGELASHLANLPMLGERQLFAVANIQSYKSTERDAVLKMVGGDDLSRVVVFTTPSARAPKKNSALVRDMGKLGEVVMFDRLSAADARRVIMQRVGSAKLNIEPDAVALLTELVSSKKGANRGAIQAETEKLINYFEPGATVHKEDVFRLCSGHEVFDIFAVADKIMAGDTHGTLKMIRRLIAEGQSEVAIVTLLNQHLLCVYLVKNGHAPLRRREFLRGKFEQQGRYYSNEQLERMITATAEVDSKLRTTGVKRQIALESLILSLAEQKKTA